MDAVVRLCLERLNAPNRAYTIVRKTKSVEAAALLARYCLQSGDFQVLRRGVKVGRGEHLGPKVYIPCRWWAVTVFWVWGSGLRQLVVTVLTSPTHHQPICAASTLTPRLPHTCPTCPCLLPQGAVEFLLLANQMDQAFDIAQGHNEMDTFARIVASSTRPVDYQRIALYYESRGEYDKAGDMWASSGQEAKAVQLYLKVRDKRGAGGAVRGRREGRARGAGERGRREGQAREGEARGGQARGGRRGACAQGCTGEGSKARKE